MKETGEAKSWSNQDPHLKCSDIMGNKLFSLLKIYVSFFKDNLKTYALKLITWRQTPDTKG